MQIGGAREEWNFFGAPKWKYREGEQRGWCKPMGLPGNTSPFEGCEKVLLAHGMCGPNTCTPFPFGKGVGWRHQVDVAMGLCHLASPAPALDSQYLSTTNPLLLLCEAVAPRASVTSDGTPRCRVLEPEHEQISLVIILRCAAACLHHHSFSSGLWQFALMLELYRSRHLRVV